MVLNKIRKLNLGWIIIMMGIGFILVGLRMTSNSGKENTLLCFDEGCVTVQGISCMTLGAFIIGLGVYNRFFKNK